MKVLTTNSKSSNTTRKILFLALCLCCCSLPLFAQQTAKMKGRVIDVNGEIMPGVTILIDGGKRGVVSGNDGSFEMDGVPVGARLTATFLGMKDREFRFDGKDDLTIVMEEKANELEEVAIVAFSKQKKESVVGSISTVKPSELKVPSSNMTAALGGRIAGIISYQRSGEPGRDDAEFFIRGVTTFGYKKDPLILIDNVELSSSDLARLQVDDIASFSIIKAVIFIQHV
jgi:hypothetical protein